MNQFSQVFDFDCSAPKGKRGKKSSKSNKFLKEKKPQMYESCFLAQLCTDDLKPSQLVATKYPQVT